MKTVAVIGGGPAGLMAAEVLSQHDLAVSFASEEVVVVVQVDVCATIVDADNGKR